MNIGFISVAHTDYIDGVATEAANRAAGVLEGLGINLTNAGFLADTDEKAAKAGLACAAADVDGVIIFLTTWVECPVVTSALREVEHLPILLWGFPMLETADGPVSTGSYVSYTMYKGVLDRIGLPFTGLLESPGGAGAATEILGFARAAAARKRLRRSKVGLIGYTSMGIYTGTFDHVLMRFMIGPEVQHIDSYTYINRMNAADGARVAKTAERFRDVARVSANVGEKDLLTASRMFEGLMDLKETMGLDAVNVKCQYEFSKEYGMVACVPLALAADSGIVASCEGDTLNTVAMMMLHLISGETVTYGDALNHEGDVLLLSSCGFSPFSMSAEKPPEIRNFPQHPGFTGLVASFTLRPEPVTVIRLVEDIGSYHILYFTGQGLESELRGGSFPALRVKMENGMEGLLRNYSGQHFAICYGDYSREIENLARMLKIGAVRV